MKWLVTRVGPCVFQSNQRVKVDLSGMVVKGVAFSQNVREALATIVSQPSANLPVYLVELLFSFKGIKGRKSQPRDEGLVAYGSPGAEGGGNEKACGVLGITSGPGKKTRHAGTVG
ncbi:MAG: hypothetical protein ACREKS_21840 [Candidatus Rokuibacteriota bacterium]